MLKSTVVNELVQRAMFTSLSNPREQSWLHPPALWGTSSLAEAVKTSPVSQSAWASSLCGLSLCHVRRSRGCITIRRPVNSVQHCEGRCKEVCVSPWVGRSCTCCALEAWCDSAERRSAWRGHSGPALIWLVLLWGRALWLKTGFVKILN